MFAKIENGNVVEYPIFPGQIEERFPEVRLPLHEHGGGSLPEGYVEIEPNYGFHGGNLYCEYVETFPIQVDGKWKQNWKEVPLNPEQLQIKRIALTHGVLKERDNRLSKTDWTQMPDCPLPEEKKQKWATYRQQLRDMTETQDFPFDAVWPVNPFKKET